MSIDHARRGVLKAGLLALPLVSGCTSDAGPEDDPTDETASPTESNANSSPDPSRLEFTASIVGQSSASSPPRMSAVLENTGEDAIELGVGDPALFATDASAGSITFLPAETGPDRSDGCWRAGSQEQFTPRDVFGWQTVQPGETVEADVDVYTSDGADRCLPSGEYTFEGGVWWSESTAIRLPSTVTVDADGEVAVQAGEPYVEE